MLSIWRRHSEKCPHKDKGRDWKRCNCPIWVDGSLNHKRVRESLETRAWNTALGIIQEWQTKGREDTQPLGVTIEEAVGAYRADMAAGGLATNTQRTYQSMLNCLEKFCADKGIRVVAQLTPDRLEMFRLSLNGGSATIRNRIVALRTMFGYWVKREWVKRNYAIDVRFPREENNPTLPFELDEILAILKGADERIALGEYRDKWIRFRTLCLVLRYSGLRVSDAVGLSVAQLNGCMLFLYTQKTNVAVMCPLPVLVLEELDRCPRVAPDRWFSRPGEAAIESAVHTYGNCLREITGKGGGFHRFRDTYAIELLEREDIGIEEIQTLLGHKSSATTTKHYLPWIMKRQVRMQKKVQDSHESDALLATLSRRQEKLKRVK